MGLPLIVVIVLVVVLLGGLPTWGYHSYGYGPSSVVGVVVVILLILIVLGRV